jgi:hypothetical protein
MKKNKLSRAIGVLGAALLVSSCAAIPKAAEAEAGPAAAALPAESGAGDGAGGGGDSGLDSAAFRDMPAEARAYLEVLAEAFTGRDENFLLSQGEARFEAEVKPGHDKESYLALLYRTGSYAEEMPWVGTQLPRLDPAGIRRIEYTHWEENGPMLEIQGRLVTLSGGGIPCKIILIWRLREPKILGLFP